MAKATAATNATAITALIEGSAKQTETLDAIMAMLTAPTESAESVSVTKRTTKSAKADATKSAAARKAKAAEQKADADRATKLAAYRKLQKELGIEAEVKPITPPVSTASTVHNMGITRDGNTLLIAIKLDGDVVPTSQGSNVYALVATTGGGMKDRLLMGGDRATDPAVAGLELPDGMALQLRLSKRIS